MVDWFLPPWIAALVLRSPWVSRGGVIRFLHFLTYQAGALAFFGLVQFASRTDSIYWLRPLQCVFFASFGYSNHAAAYFVLMGSLAAGLLYREIFKCDSAPKRGRLALLGCTLVLCLTGANLSLSRAGVIWAWTLACFAAVYGLFRGWTVLPPVGRLNLAVGTVAAVCVLYFAVSGFGSHAIGHRFQARTSGQHVLIPLLDKINLDLGAERKMLWRIAWRMWHEAPWLGLGGWGYRYCVAFYLPQVELDKLPHNSGLANVHCDFLQFLVEFGAIGVGLGMVAVGCLLWPLLTTMRNGGALWVMTTIGLCLVIAFSMIDLPFRCPAITLTWVALFAALPRVTGTETDRHKSACAATRLVGRGRRSPPRRDSHALGAAQRGHWRPIQGRFWVCGGKSDWPGRDLDGLAWGASGIVRA